LSRTTDETKKIELIQEMNKIREAVEQLNQSRLSLEEIVHTISYNAGFNLGKGQLDRLADKKIINTMLSPSEKNEIEND
ncbi:414_t:CDS:2, partial [Funneliformis geosporum]